MQTYFADRPEQRMLLLDLAGGGVRGGELEGFHIVSVYDREKGIDAPSREDALVVASRDGLFLMAADGKMARLATVDEYPHVSQWVGDYLVAGGCAFRTDLLLEQIHR